MAYEIHLITQAEAHMLLQGEPLNCGHHEHIRRDKAKELMAGANKASFEWAMLRDGSISLKHLVILEAREWRRFAGVMQWLPLGTAKQGMKRTRTHLRKPIQYSLTQCADVNRGQRQKQSLS